MIELKRILSLILSAVFIAGFLPVVSFGADKMTWEGRETSYKESGSEWPFKPPADYISCQNSPDFMWPNIPYATGYDLIVAADKEMKDIKYSAYDIKLNCYNFPYSFETGIYYWSVRFKSGNEYSDWTEPSRFLLRPDAYSYAVIGGEDSMNKIPKSHPRLGICKDDIEEFRKLKDGEGKAFYESLKSTVEGYMQNPYPPEPKFNPKNEQEIRNTTLGCQNRMINSAILYLIDGDTKVGKWCAGLMAHVSGWDVNGETKYENQDQAFREILYGTSVAYDLAGDMLTPEQKSTVLNMLDKRMRTLEHPTAGLQDSPYRVPENPYMSHGFSATTVLLCAAVATLGEVEFASFVWEKYLPLWIAIAPPWGWEDGAWANGTSYSQWGLLTDTLLVYTLDKYNIAKVSNKAYFRNVYKYILYLVGSSVGCTFGDDNGGEKFNGNFAMYNHFLYKFCGIPYAEWMNNALGIKGNNEFATYLISEIEREEPKMPVDLPNSIVFKDVGISAHHSELMDFDSRVSLYFRSSRYGSYNHSHADNNGFVITAYGEYLAGETAQYATYNSEWHNYYYQASHAHNCLTIDNGYGQVQSQMDRNHGEIINYLTHPDFDLVSGSDHEGYNYRMISKWGHITDNLHLVDKYLRHIIYIRPDQYIVIDDIHKENGEPSTYEFWLNTAGHIKMYRDKTGISINKGAAAMDVKVHSPKVTGNYSDYFCNTDLEAWLPPDSAKAALPAGERVWFQTEPAPEAKIVTTMSVHKKDEPAQYVDSENHGNYIKMTFEDGTRVYVNLTDSEFEADGYKTDAAALVLKKETIMTVYGTKVERDGELLFSSEERSSYIYGKDELSLSAEKDTKVKIKVKPIDKMVNENGSEIVPGKMEWGFNWNYENGYFNADVFKGYYTNYLNGKPMPGSTVGKGTLKYIIDGREYETETEGYYDHDGNKVIPAMLNDCETDFYYLDKAENIDIRSNSKPGDLLMLRKGETVKLLGDNPSLELRSLAGGNVMKALVDPDYRAVRGKMDVFCEMEDYTEAETDSTPYEKSFLSGNAGMKWFQTFGDHITWEVEAPEDGEYYFVVKYAGWGGNDDGNLERLLEVNDQSASLLIPATNNYGQIETEWVAATTDKTFTLKKGKNKITMYPKVGNWNTDWIGFIKQ